MSRGLLLLVAFVIVLMIGASLLLLALAREREKRLNIGRRLDDALYSVAKAQQERTPPAMRWIGRMLHRSGLSRHPAQLVLLGVAFIPVYALAYLYRGPVGLLFGFGLYFICIYLLILWRTASAHRVMVGQLPGFIDQIIRVMAVGRSFDSALLEAIDDSPPPLCEALEPVKIETSLGGDTVDALGDVARLYDLKELHLLTLALRINQRYGGSIKAMLESIIGMIRQREQAERELRALTGETRLSAWVLGCLPLAMAGYMMLMNPTYIRYLLDDPGGPRMIGIALGLQATGSLLIWRMLRSIQ